jgi:hypothetical protein
LPRLGEKARQSVHVPHRDAGGPQFDIMDRIVGRSRTNDVAAGAADRAAPHGPAPLALRFALSPAQHQKIAVRRDPLVEEIYDRLDPPDVKDTGLAR